MTYTVSSGTLNSSIPYHPHQTGFVGECSNHLQLVKFWPSCDPGKGVCGGAKASAQCLRLYEHFFLHFSCFYRDATAGAAMLRWLWPSVCLSHDNRCVKIAKRVTRDSHWLENLRMSANAMMSGESVGFCWWGQATMMRLIHVVTCKSFTAVV